jgi:hypothetical protein
MAVVSTTSKSLRNLSDRIKYSLPRGRTLPNDVWERRHRGILILLWLHDFAVPAFAISQGYPVGHSRRGD